MKLLNNAKNLLQLLVILLMPTQAFSIGIILESADEELQYLDHCDAILKKVRINDETHIYIEENKYCNEIAFHGDSGTRIFSLELGYNEFTVDCQNETVSEIELRHRHLGFIQSIDIYPIYYKKYITVKSRHPRVVSYINTYNPHHKRVYIDHNPHKHRRISLAHDRPGRIIERKMVIESRTVPRHTIRTYERPSRIIHKRSSHGDRNYKVIRHN